MVVDEGGSRESAAARGGRRIGSSTSDNRSPIASGVSPCSPTSPSTCTLWEAKPIGCGKFATQLLKWLVQNRGLDALEKDKNTGKLYADHLCYFRCLARHRGCGLKILERKTPELASTYLATLEHPESFVGVRLRDLHAQDNLFGMHTLVYALAEDGKVVHRPTAILSKQKSQAAFRLNLYSAHFSYVKHMTKDSRCFTCQRCDASYPKAHCLQRHEQSCEAKVKRVYPGGVYHPSQTIF